MHGNSQVARINGAAAAADAWAPQDAAESLSLLDKIDAKYSYSSVTNGANGVTNGASAPAAPVSGGHHHAYVTRNKDASALSGRWGVEELHRIKV